MAGEYWKHFDPLGVITKIADHKRFGSSRLPSIERHFTS